MEPAQQSAEDQAKEAINVAADKISRAFEHPNRDADRRFGRNIAYGVQQTIACWATDFIDPYVSKWFQNKYGNKEHHVTSAHTWGGEIAGDSAAFFVYMGLKQTFTKPIDGVVAAVKGMMDMTLTKLGKKALKPWAVAEHIAEDSPKYQKKLESYKEFQAENMVDSTIIATAATGLNVGAQRYVFGNKQGLGLILVSKLIGAASTIGVMLGLRTALPTTMKSLDDEIEQRFVTPVTKQVKKAFGARDVGERYDELPTVHVDHVTKVAHNSLMPQLDVVTN